MLSSGSKLLDKTKLTPDYSKRIHYLGTAEGISTPAFQDVPLPLPAVKHKDAVDDCRPERVSKLVFYAQSTSVVISGRRPERGRKKWRVIKKMPTQDKETPADCATLLSLHIHTHIQERERTREREGVRLRVDREMDK